jgi:hypothetical protein
VLATACARPASASTAIAPSAKRAKLRPLFVLFVFIIIAAYLRACVQGTTLRGVANWRSRNACVPNLSRERTND